MNLKKGDFHLNEKFARNLKPDRRRLIAPNYTVYQSIEIETVLHYIYTIYLFAIQNEISVNGQIYLTIYTRSIKTRNVFHNWIRVRPDFMPPHTTVGYNTILTSVWRKYTFYKLY